MSATTLEHEAHIEQQKQAEEAEFHQLSTEGEVISPNMVLASGDQAKSKYGVQSDVLAEFELGTDDPVEGLQIQLLRNNDGTYMLHTMETAHYDEHGNEIPDEANAVVTDKKHHVMKLPNDGTTITIGRNDQTQQLISDAKSRVAVSRKHIEFSVGDDGVSVRDGGSLNGTRVKTGEVQNTEQEEGGENADDTVDNSKHLEALIEIADDEKTRALLELQDGFLLPQADVAVGNKQFLISRVYKASEASKQLRAILYSEDDDTGMLHASYLYKSRSDGGWRVSPGLEKLPDGSNRLMKGGDRHYTQENKLAHEILDVLDELEQADIGVEPEVAAAVGDISAQDAFTEQKRFVDEVEVVRLESLLRFASEVDSLRYEDLEAFAEAHSPKGEERTPEQTADGVLAILNYALKKREGFVPNFKRDPIAEVTRDHSLLGPTKYSTYDGELDGRKVEWEMAEAKAGSVVWVNAIRYKDSNTSSFGTDTEVIESGIITSKPLEYVHQATGVPDSLKKAVDGNPNYVDISRFLAELYPVEQYKKFRRR